MLMVVNIVILALVTLKIKSVNLAVWSNGMNAVFENVVSITAKGVDQTIWLTGKTMLCVRSIGKQNQNESPTKRLGVQGIHTGSQTNLGPSPTPPTRCW